MTSCSPFPNSLPPFVLREQVNNAKMKIIINKNKNCLSSLNLPFEQVPGYTLAVTAAFLHGLKTATVGFRAAAATVMAQVSSSEYNAALGAQ